MKIKKIKIIFKLILTIFFINLGSCGLKITDNHGQIFDSNLSTDLFKEGKTTKEEITNILGTPSIKSTFDGGKSWFYVSSEFEKFIFLDGENIDQKILIFEFGDNNVLNKKKFLSKADLNDIDYEVAVTDSSGKKLNWYREFFRNLNPDPFGANQ